MDHPEKEPDDRPDAGADERAGREIEGERLGRARRWRRREATHHEIARAEPRQDDRCGHGQATERGGRARRAEDGLAGQRGDQLAE
jgi:hypothetical protein